MIVLNEKEMTKYMRNLAKSYKYQSLFALAKEMKLKIFKNDWDFSELQTQFLNWLNFYYSIRWDIDMGDISEKVLEHPIYEEAYVYWKNKKKGKEQSTVSKNKRNQDVETQKSIQWIFKK